MKNFNLRLLLFEECNRRCEGCCNKDWDLKKLPTPKHYLNYNMVMLTGGEPMLRPDVIKETVTEIRLQSEAKIVIYTAMTKDPERFLDILSLVDGVTLTLHDQADVKPFKHLCDCLSASDLKGKTMWLNIFDEVECCRIPEYWQVKDKMVWIKNCPLPDNEVLMRLPYRGENVPTCDYCGELLGEEYWDIESLSFYRDCPSCKRRNDI